MAREYGLEWDARQRAAGIARTMASAGYKTAQVMTSDGFEWPLMATALHLMGLYVASESLLAGRGLPRMASNCL